jgi:Rps23 Pro-64 3,4-dihydroxylase Tpa1-like proline 4-hydroxylase
LSQDERNLGRSPILDLETLERDVEALSILYRSASPFPHIVLDDFLETKAVQQAVEEIALLNGERWNAYVHINERKFSHTDPSSWGPGLRSILDQLESPQFARFLCALTGIDGLFVDPTLDGGGLHRSTTGGFLNIHADFTVHPHRNDWRRRVNLLLYFNEEWQPEYGGNLELWSTDMKQCQASIAPVGNRAVIFTTDVDSFHGHPKPLRCPAGVNRQSLALYYFTLETHPFIRSTEYRARPGDGPRSALIYADKQLLRAYDWSKRHLGISDKTAFKILERLDRTRHRNPRN